MFFFYQVTIWTENFLNFRFIVPAPTEAPVQPQVTQPPKVPVGPDGKPPKGPDGKVVTPVGPDGKPEGQKGPDGKPTPPDNGKNFSH